MLFTVIAVPLSARRCDAADQLLTKDCGDIIGAFADGDEFFYILSAYQNNYKITIIDGSLNCNEILLETDIHPYDLFDKAPPYAFFDGKFYFFCSSAKIQDGKLFSFITVKIADCRSGVITTRVINNESCREYGAFAYDGRYFYIPDTASIKLYSDTFMRDGEIELSGQPYSLSSSRDGCITYCAASNGLYIIENGSLICRSDIITGSVFTFDGGFSDDRSTVYNADGSQVLFDGFDSSNGVGKVGDRLIGVIDNTLTAVRGDERVCICDASGECFICSGGTRCACFCIKDNGLSARIVTDDEIEALSKPESPNTESDCISDISDAGEHMIKHMTAYTLDKENGFIRGIEPGTTPAAFNRSENTSVNFYSPDGTAIKSGTVKTGCTAEFPNGETFITVITGDVSGSGTINSRDVKCIADHLSGEAPLDGAYLSAADVVHDGTVDLKDSAALYRYTKGCYNLTQTQ